MMEYALIEQGMPWGYLLFACGMLHVARRGGNKYIVKESVVTFMMPLLSTECAPGLLATNFAVVWGLRGWHARLLSSWIGSLAVFVQGVAMWTLLQSHRANVETRHALRKAMRTMEVSEHRIRKVKDLAWNEWLGVFLPLPQQIVLPWISYRGVHLVKTLTFAHVGEPRTTPLKLDVYKHKNTPRNAPIFVYVHGGSWMFGTRKNPPLALLHQVASLGWVVCSVDYRLSPGVAFPAHLIDVKRAIAYLKLHAREELDANPEFMVIAGESAGGHLASLIALTASDMTLQPGFEDVDTSVQGCIDNYGVHDIKDRHGVWFCKDQGRAFIDFMEFIVMQQRLPLADAAFDVASPLSWLQRLATESKNSTVPPFLISHGTHDTLVPFEDSRIFFEHLQKFRSKQANNEHLPITDAFMEIPGAHHAFNYVFSPRAIAYGQVVCAFLDQLYENAMNTTKSNTIKTNVHSVNAQFA